MKFITMFKLCVRNSYISIVKLCMWFTCSHVRMFGLQMNSSDSSKCSDGSDSRTIYAVRNNKIADYDYLKIPNGERNKRLYSIEFVTLGFSRTLLTNFMSKLKIKNGRCQYGKQLAKNYLILMKFGTRRLSRYSRLYLPCRYLPCRFPSFSVELFPHHDRDGSTSKNCFFLFLRCRQCFRSYNAILKGKKTLYASLIRLITGF